ncbi:MAG: D-glycerate dehydrogenase [Gaiellales bacterium]|nr:D-glycerate dehydrogenase [Gaiellales bacterium]
MSRGRPRAFVTRLLPEPAPSLLGEVFELCGNLGDRPLTSREILEGVPGASAIVCTLADRIDAAVLSAAGAELRVVSNFAVGFDNIDVTAATKRGVLVATTPDVLTEATAELTWALILAAARRVVEGDALVRSGRFTGWSPSLLLGKELTGGVLGIVGMGRIGRAVARRAAGFGMRVLYTRRSGPLPAEAVPGGEQWGFAANLHALLASADVVSLHVPLGPETRHLISAPELAAMKWDAILVNAARGPVVDEAALAETLRQGHLFAAALDVYENEPVITPGLEGLTNVVLLPHVGSATVATRRKMAESAARNAIAAVRGLPGVNAVNLQVPCVPPCARVDQWRV